MKKYGIGKIYVYKEDLEDLFSIWYAEHLNKQFKDATVALVDVHHDKNTGSRDGDVEFNFVVVPNDGSEIDGYSSWDTNRMHFSLRPLISAMTTAREQGTGQVLVKWVEPKTDEVEGE